MSHIDDLTSGEWTAAHALEADGPALPEGFSTIRWPEIDRAALLPRWRRLAHEAASPNPFCEDWFLLPGLREFDPQGEVRIVTLVRHGRLVGLLPIVHAARYHGRRMPHWAGWHHPNVFCGEPLVVAGHEDAFCAHLLACADRAPGNGLFLHFGDLHAESAFVRSLQSLPGRNTRVVHREQRAMLNHGLSPEAHLAAASSKKRRKEFARRRRRLSEEGMLEVLRQDDASDLSVWIDDFLALERAGWKGQEGSALACDPRTEALFREGLTGAAKAGRLQRLAFTLDGRPIAMLATFLTPPAAFSFKTAYDEALAAFSPGMLLQIENLALLERTDIAWCDSCAAPDHPMIDHIWRDRRAMVKISIPIGGPLRRGIGSLLTALEARRWETRP